jgi:hypothetical protein
LGTFFSALPGQSPWVNQQSTLRPVRAKALKISFHSTF